MQIHNSTDGMTYCSFTLKGHKERFTLYGDSHKHALSNIPNEYAAYNYCKKHGVKEEISDCVLDFSEINQMLGIKSAQ